jgi:hypothetical protein
VNSQVAEDPEPALYGDVAERASAGAPGPFPLLELAAVETGDCGGQASRDGIEMAAAARSSAALFLIARQAPGRGW